VAGLWLAALCSGIRCIDNVYVWKSGPWKRNVGDRKFRRVSHNSRGRECEILCFELICTYSAECALLESYDCTSRPRLRRVPVGYRICTIPRFFWDGETMRGRDKPIPSSGKTCLRQASTAKIVRQARTT
jgi:hypothetical protein